MYQRPDIKFDALSRTLPIGDSVKDHIVARLLSRHLLSLT